MIVGFGGVNKDSIKPISNIFNITLPLSRRGFYLFIIFIYKITPMCKLIITERQLLKVIKHIVKENETIDPLSIFGFKLIGQQRLSDDTPINLYLWEKGPYKIRVLKGNKNNKDFYGIEYFGPSMEDSSKKDYTNLSVEWFGKKFQFIDEKFPYYLENSVEYAKSIMGWHNAPSIPRSR